MRHIWDDHNHRQEFEHDLINRKTTWLLTTQALLFAAYGVTFIGDRIDGMRIPFRNVVAYSGLAIAAIVVVGVCAVIISKFLSWKAYRAFFDSNPIALPMPLDQGKLQWGVHTVNTLAALAPDVLLPVVFIVAWWQLAGRLQ
jgi:hypothetical protein